MLRFVRKYSIKDLPFESQPKNKYNARSAFNLKPNPTQGLIHNPPSAMPSVKDTPKAFLPANDPRLRFMADKFRVYSAEELQDMPLLYGIRKEKDYSLTPQIVGDIVKLRNEDPEQWTVSKLASKFNVDIKKVNVITGIHKERQEKLLRDLNAVKETWNEKRRVARQDKEKRTKMWLRNEF